MTTKIKTITSLFTLALMTACTSDAQLGRYSDSLEQPPEDYTPKDQHKLDVLFVVDSSVSMNEEQVSMTENISALVEQLEGLPGGLPSLHIAVVSADMGAGPFGIAGCQDSGDDGAFYAGSNDCNGPSDSFISNEIDSEGNRITNYSGSLDEAFQCSAQIGVDGCGFEQPLLSMRRGLEQAATTDGFLRDDAHLAVVILTDEDDCSASDTSIFDSSSDQEQLLGVLSSFRCAEFGVQCDGGTLDRAEGHYEDCEPTENSPYLYHPDAFVSYLQALKGSLNDVIVTVIAGERNGLDVSVIGSPSHVAVAPACVSENGNASPAYRLGYFAEQFPNHLVTSICNADLNGAMNRVGVALAAGMSEEDPGTDDSDAGNGDSAGCQVAGTKGSGSWFALLSLLTLGVIRKRKTSALR